MPKYDLSKTVARGAGGRLYAAISKDDRVRLVCLGAHEEMRYRFNQIACLVGGVAVQKLLTYPPAPGLVSSAGTPPPGQWEDKLFGVAPVSTPESLFELAARGPNSDSDRVGCLAFSGYWPHDMWRLPGVQPMTKCISESLGRVFYDCLQYPTVRVGTAAEHTVARRTKEAIAAATRAGFTPYDEPGLRQFLEVLTTARFLQFFHEVNAD
jgi:hypothetical protein